MDIKQIVKKNIEESKERMKHGISKDSLIIFFTRIFEDLKKYENPNFYGRVKDLYFLINPYSVEKNAKAVFLKFLDSDLISKDGLCLDDEEKYFVRIVASSLTGDCKFKYPKVMKGRIKGILDSLIKKYFPNSVKHVESYILGKLISFFGGTKNLCFRSAGTIQLVGAEKALFAHISKRENSPKYGLLYYSKYVQQSGKNKGAMARKIANKLAISLRVDYFKYILNSGVIDGG